MCSSFLHTLRSHGELLEVDCPVDPSLEIAEIHRRVVRERGPALFFSRVKGSSFPVVTNLFGSEKRLFLALGFDIFERLALLASLFDQPQLSKFWSLRREVFSFISGGKRVRSRSQLMYGEKSSLSDIPFLKTWPGDGGSFLTLPLVYTQSPISKKENLGMYRVQRHGSSCAGLHWQLGKGGSFHCCEAETLQQDLPVVVYLGGPPALILSAITPLPENISEILFASLLMRKRIPLVHALKFPLPLIDVCDVAITGKAFTCKRKEEGPFGDHFGYLDSQKPFPLFQVEKIYHKKNAVIPATVVGKPFQEDSYIGQFIQKLIKPFLPFAFPSLVDLYSYPETGFHALTSICIKERYRKEALALSLKILGDGQLSLTKILFVIDESIPLDDIRTVLPHLLERFNPEEDLLILPSTANDTLDMTGPAPDHGSKAVFFGLGLPKKVLPKTISTPLPPPIANAVVFTPGCLVVDGIHAPLDDLSLLLKRPCFEKWPLVVVVDDALGSTSSSLEFLWTVFTRFEPAKDIYASDCRIHRNSILFSGSLLIDARMKASYSPPLQASQETCSLVDRRYDEYFPHKKPY